ncbi:MAG: S10 family peptidase [Pseudohaliea sp.]
MRKRFLASLCFALGLPLLAHAQTETPAPSIPEPTAFVTEHRGTFNGTTVSYEARAGETYLRDAEGEPTAAIFSFAYLAKDGGEDRPVTFVWNGGPGSASLWLHMGTFGPKRVVVPSDASHPGVPPYPIVDAAESILDITDLVFVDPVGTGYSRALGDHESTEFWGLTEDAESMAEFIRRWLSANGRWNSPKFLLGESFGTTRAALVAKLLEDEYRVALNGLVMISQALDYAGSSPYVRDNLISYVTYVPTMAATAWHHGKVDREGTDLETFLQEARDFAVDELLPALFRGNTLDKETRARVREGLVRYTGLSPTYVERADLRINGFRFASELLRDKGLAVGLNDARYTADPVDNLAARPENDAAGDAFSAAFTGALLSYLHGDLGVDWERPYLSPADPELSGHWNWSRKAPGETWEPHWVNTARDLARALEANPALRVFVAGGYHDLVTPFFDAEFTLRRHGIGADRVDFHFYHGGHMMYVHEPSRQALLEDVRAFMDGALRP